MKVDKKSITSKNRVRLISLAEIALFAALIAVCSAISIPLPSGVPVTLQTFAVFVTAGYLGAKRSAVAVGVYIMLGAIGLPVFSNFGGGIGVLLGVTGGYIIGFLFQAPITGYIAQKFKRSNLGLIISMLAGLAICYAFGTAWFMYVYTTNTGAITLPAVLSLCVVPYLIPDAVKILAATVIVKRLNKIRPIYN